MGSMNKSERSEVVGETLDSNAELVMMFFAVIDMMTAYVSYQSALRRGQYGIGLRFVVL